VVVHDVPLLVEARLADRYDLVVVVEAAPTARLARVMARGLTEADARARMAAQASDSERRAAADVLVPNDGDLGDLEDHVAALWRRLADLSAASDRDDPVGGTS
jgi:dephospho-CoA kinase